MQIVINQTTKHVQREMKRLADESSELKIVSDAALVGRFFLPKSLDLVRIL